MNRTVRHWLAGLAAVLVLGMAPGSAMAENTAEEAGFGALAALSSLVYGPVKVVYALGGAVVGGFAWVFSAGDNDVAIPIWNRSVRGDYVVTPQNIRGEKPLEFIGRDPAPEYAAPPVSSDASDSSW